MEHETRPARTSVGPPVKMSADNALSPICANSSLHQSQDKPLHSVGNCADDDRRASCASPSVAHVHNFQRLDKSESSISQLDEEDESPGLYSSTSIPSQINDDHGSSDDDHKVEDLVSTFARRNKAIMSHEEQSLTAFQSFP